MKDSYFNLFNTIQWSNVAQQTPQFSLLPKVINGCLAGVMGVAVVYPLDLTKTRWQSQPVGQRLYTSAFDCLVKTIKKEGYFGIYKGSSAYVMLIAPEKAVKLSMNDFYRYQLQDENGYLPLHKQIVAAILAGLSAMWITTPMDLLKIDIQNAGRNIDKNNPKRKTGFDIIKGVYRKSGFFGFYKGFCPTVTRDMAFASIYFPLFSFLSGFGPKKENGDSTFWCNFLCGLCSGSCTAFSITPIDVIKTRFQLISNVDNSLKYNGIRDAIKKIYKTEGFRAFYKGAGCRMMVVGPLYAVAQTVYYLKVAEKLLGQA